MSASQDRNPDLERQHEAFVLEFGAAIHRAGASSQRLELLLLEISERLGLEAQVFSTPTSLWCAFGPVETQRTLLTRVAPTETNLERLVKLDALGGQIARGEVGSVEGRRLVREIMGETPRFGPMLLPPLFAASSACVSVFFGGSVRDIVAAAVVGVVIGAFLVVSLTHTRLARGMDFLSGFMASALAGLSATYVGGINPLTVTIAGLITLVPGLTLTIAMSELAARHLVSGTARLMHAAIILLAIGFGVALGRSLFAPGDIPLPEPLPAWAMYVALGLIPFALAPLFQARPRDWPVVALAAWLGFFSARLGAEFLGPELGASAGAFAVGLVANAYARFKRLPSAVATIPGIMLLVPGSLGLRTFDALLSDDTLTGLDTAFGMLLVASGIVAGLLLSNVVLPSRQPL